MGKRKIIYMKVTRDKYRLPVAVADSAKELAWICGVSVDAIYSCISRRKKGEWDGSYLRVKVEDDEEHIK